MQSTMAFEKAPRVCNQTSQGQPHDSIGYDHDLEAARMSRVRVRSGWATRMIESRTLNLIAIAHRSSIKSKGNECNEVAQILEGFASSS